MIKNDNTVINKIRALLFCREQLNKNAIELIYKQYGIHRYIQTLNNF